MLDETRVPNDTGYIITEQACTLFHDNQVYTVHNDHKWFEDIIGFIRDGDFDDAIDAMKPAKAVQDFFRSDASFAYDVELREDTIFVNGIPSHRHIAERAVTMAREGLPVEPLLNLISRIEENPSYRARQELFGFLEYGKLPITPDGFFLAYKRVRSDYTDCHTGSFDNSVGSFVRMPRTQVDDDCNHTCSAGLHFCSLEYLSNFYGERIVVLKIDPADVVSIPTDYNNTKGRCCGYKVVGELSPEQVEEVNEMWANRVIDDFEDADELELEEEAESEWSDEPCDDADCWCRP